VTEIYEMWLHDEIDMGCNSHIIRVPGGWIYLRQNFSDVNGWTESQVFVPFDNEFQSVK